VTGVRPASGQHDGTIGLLAPGEATRLARVLREHPSWSVFWDRHCGVWRAAEDDPDSSLYAESPDLDTIIGYITAHG
jgi:hypothetical protein